MFDKKKYVTRGIDSTLGLHVQLMLWRMIDNLEGEKDYLQVFEMTKINENTLKIVHRQEEPAYEKSHTLHVDSITEDSVKVFVIDDGDYSTMLLASEY
jgi:hypothetical protein